ncbi:PEP-CTERM protein-sorting domain-containing protein [Rubritalea squalenifaciens DSM 18772]|uniref:PEP-CTERM protein-sorting domain-containing protein n=1 Tax=Rubritalea squalenifaciens DSM 18772 TaxID=1123071 RepID=A0A1M6NH71_9BACT|nr:PEP-CTERM sorting domain-containing protein [Rubritalea squalenifaciens]SHJ94964.1 PEP-CTERM protein-sorting domain-containing protein [Rubritalea squalenifaciens DSM 18772]
MCVKSTVMGVATSVFLANSAYSSTVVANAFSHSGGPAGPVTAGSLIALGDSETGTLGDGWSTTVTLGAGVIYNLSASMPGDGSFQISGTGVTGALGSVSSTRIFNETLNTGQTYELTIGVSQASAVGLLQDVEIEIGYHDNVNGFTSVDLNTNHAGLLGVVDVLGLFGSSDTASFQFTVNEDFAGNDLYVKIDTGTTAGLLGESVVFDNLSLTAVPEPSSLSLSALGCTMLLLRRRRK